MESVFNSVSSVIDMAGGLDHSVTTLTVADGSVFPASDAFRVIVDNEIMLVTAVVSNDLTVTRGQEGTASMAHKDGSPVMLALTAGGLLATFAGGGGGSLPVTQDYTGWNWYAFSGDLANYLVLDDRFYRNCASPAAGDKFRLDVYLLAGDYDLYMDVITDNFFGIASAEFDGVAVSASPIDFYTASVAASRVLIGSVTVTEGNHRLELHVTGKNGSSSNYFVLCGGCTFKRTA